jgi:nucleoside-diphosphate-sugar epimerase
MTLHAPPTPLTVAVTGPTGTFGTGLLPRLAADVRVGRVVGLSRRPPERTTGDTEFREADVSEPASLVEGFRGADVVVHLAYQIIGNVEPEARQRINVDGSLNAFRAAVAAGARRFVHASSVAAYGFSSDLPASIIEDEPLRPDDRFFYAAEKAAVEDALRAEADAHPEVELYVLRPCGVVGPDTTGAKDLAPGTLAPFVRRVADHALRARFPLPIPVPVPGLRFQLVHHDDVGQALLRAALGDGPPGAYNIAGDGVVTLADLLRELGAVPITLPEAVGQIPARLVSALPLPPPLQWVKAATYPVLMDTTRARVQLGWRPRFRGIEAWRDTLRRS